MDSKGIVTIFWVSALWLATCLSGQAQDEVAVDQQLWLEYLVDYDLSKKIELYADASYRTVFFKDLNNSHRIMARPSMKWAVSQKVDVRGGIGIFYTSLNDSTQALELRPWQGVSVRWPVIGKQRFSHFFRLEERLTYRLEPWSQANSVRLRYQLSTRIDFGRGKVVKYFYMPLAMEFFFVPAGEKTFDLSRNDARFTVGLGYVVNYRLALEGRFVLQRSRLSAGNFGVTDQIFRIMLRHSLFPFDEEQEEVVH